MSNDITTKTGSNGGSNLPATPSDNPFLSYAEAARQTAIVGSLLKFSKGDWTVGMENDLVEDGTRFVANMDEMLRGWVRWSDNKPTDHIMGKVSKNYQPPRRSELGDLDAANWEVDENGKERDPWQETNYLLLMGTEDDMKGELFTFTTSSRGGLNSLADLCMRYGKLARQRDGQYPVVKIGQGSYAHSNKSYGRIKYPTFEIVGWVAKSSFPKPDADLLEDDRAGEADDNPAAIAAPATAKAPPRAKAKARF